MAEGRKSPAMSDMRPSWEKRGRRRSSVMMQKELMPLIIPSVSPSRSIVSEERTAIPDGKDETPPTVPPKSPRTESRASPRPKQMAHSASSSTSTLHSMSSQATSVSSVSGKSSPQPFHNLHRAGSPASQRGGLYDSEGQSSGVSPRNRDRYGRDTPPRAESPLVQPSISHPTGALAHQDGIGRQTPPLVRSFSSDKAISTSSDQKATLGLKMKLDRVGSTLRAQKPEELTKEKITFGHVASGKPLWHQRGSSEASVLHRGRPGVREEAPVVQKPSRTALKGPSLSEEKTVLPTGFKVKEVSGKLLESDLKVLKAQADEQVMNFEVLSVKDVSNLSKVCEFRGSPWTSLIRA